MYFENATPEHALLTCKPVARGASLRAAKNIDNSLGVAVDEKGVAA